MAQRVRVKLNCEACNGTGIGTYAAWDIYQDNPREACTMCKGAKFLIKEGELVGEAPKEPVYTLSRVFGLTDEEITRLFNAKSLDG